MALENLRRVMYLLKERNPDGIFSRLEVDRAIMKTCGAHWQTVKYNKRALLKLGWIKHWNYKFKLTDLFETDDIE